MQILPHRQQEWLPWGLGVVVMEVWSLLPYQASARSFVSPNSVSSSRVSYSVILISQALRSLFTTWEKQSFGCSMNCLLASSPQKSFGMWPSGTGPDSGTFVGAGGSAKRQVGLYKDVSVGDQLLPLDTKDPSKVMKVEQIEPLLLPFICGPGLATVEKDARGTGCWYIRALRQAKVCQFSC